MLGFIGATVFGGFKSGFVRRLAGLVFLGISFVVIVANLIADICYALFDPRIRYR